LLSLCSIGPVGAAVYKWVDAEGVVHYSDEPEGGAKPITLPELSVVPFREPVAPPPKPSEPALPGAAPERPESPPPESASHPPSATESPQASSGDEPAATLDSDYQHLTIRVPANNETVSSPSAELDIELILEPELRSTDSIQLFLDGQKVRDELHTTRFSISGLEVGSHILEARVVGPEGNLLRRSKSLLFHYQP